MKKLAILSLDVATSTGWALLDHDGAVVSGVQRFDLGRGESSGMRFLRFSRWLDEVVPRDPMPTSLSFLSGPGPKARINREGRLVDVIAFERPSFFRSQAAGEVIHGLLGHMHGFAAHHKIETLPVQTAVLKRHATGKGNAKKPAMIEAAAKRWGRDAESLGDDEADALCVLAWAMDELGVKEATRAKG